MNTIKLSVLASTLLILTSISSQAQFFEISIYSAQSSLFGDFTETDLNNKGAGYASIGSSFGVELNYYLKNNIGFGLRTSSTVYMADKDKYQTDIKNSIGITDDNYDFSNQYLYAHASFGSEFGISYLLDVSEKLQLEPFMYVGFRVLGSPATSVVYSENNNTHTYQKKSAGYLGFSYAPGVRLKWNVHKRINLNAHLEYQGRNFIAGDETSITQSYNSLEIETTERKYTINGIALGLGISYKFGKGLTE